GGGGGDGVAPGARHVVVVRPRRRGGRPARLRPRRRCLGCGSPLARRRGADGAGAAVHAGERRLASRLGDRGADLGARVRDVGDLATSDGTPGVTRPRWALALVAMMLVAGGSARAATRGA